jgi:hypothetical protein
MIKLEHTIEINCNPDSLFEWFINLDKNFTIWNTNHKKFVKVTGGTHVGDKVYFEQCISGKWLENKVTISTINKNENGWKIEAVTPPFARLEFTCEVKENRCLFTHSESFGFIKSKKAFVQNFLIPLLMKLLNPFYRFDLIQKDIIEDNYKLKEIIEMNMRYDKINEDSTSA